MKRALIEARGLCKSYISGKVASHILKNIDLDIYDGDFTVIMGSSGSGKSTLLYALSTMDEPTEGHVRLFGRDIQSMAEKDKAHVRKTELSFIFQSINLLPDLNAFENVAYIGYGTAAKSVINARADELLERVGLAGDKTKFPSELSGGQQQRVAIARALINHPKLVFGDEPTGALNSTTSEQVLDLLTELNADGQSIVMVTHDIQAAVRATRLLYLKDGRIEAEIGLGPYHAQARQAREESLLQFLKELGW
ncbi:MAG: ABC transporter ATP-binding protein [Sporolactobacillus sp.]